jgi:hypothetical protein
MWHILSKYGVPAKIIEIFKNLYTNAGVKVLHNGKIGASFKVGSGVKQGCILSPLTTRSSSQGLSLGNEAIEEVNKFVYLGSIISTSGGAEEDALNRIRLANVAFASLRHVWSSSRLSLRLKLKIFNSNVKSVLLYSCETWKVTKTLSHRLQVFVNKCLRSICGIFYPELITNTDLRTRTGQRLLAIEIGTRKWNWIGHTLRKSPEDITRQALTWNPPGRRKQGRPAVTWQSSVCKEAAQQGRTFSELAELAKNRTRFKSFVGALRFTVEQ